ncbi:hypothetical protein [Evansella clarkii]|uniref:hypothetical protein n=1 Tax=Evansella clarkii TaxID=79879 RepID=UPI000997B3EA|nr:hypothetical protein [Evansella clarkii]
MKISTEMFKKSSSWIKRNARPLEAARWEYLFEGGSRDKVIKYLSAFQNEDGGFGLGIEPDFWSPYSSPMATWAAGQILMEIGAMSDEKVVKSMITYLANTYQKESGMWFSVLPENNQYPHASWWHWQEGVQENWMFNPSAELAALLVHWSPKHSETAQIGWSAIEEALNHLFNVDEMDKHEINNYQRLLKVLNLHKTTFTSKFPYLLSEVSDIIMSLAERCVERDVYAWSTGYNPLPLDFIDSPNHPLCEKFGDLVEHNLVFYVEKLSDEGTWDISWNWGSYPEEFAVAKRYWKGLLAVDRYKTLKSFELI